MRSKLLRFLAVVGLAMALVSIALADSLPVASAGPRPTWAEATAARDAASNGGLKSTEWFHLWMVLLGGLIGLSGAFGATRLGHRTSRRSAERAAARSVRNDMKRVSDALTMLHTFGRLRALDQLARVGQSLSTLSSTVLDAVRSIDEQLPLTGKRVQRGVRGIIQPTLLVLMAMDGWFDVHWLDAAEDLSGHLLDLADELDRHPVAFQPQHWDRSRVDAFFVDLGHRRSPAG
jgi:hypothetical protein